MTHLPPINCVHLDNWGDCRIFHGQNRLLKFLGARPLCILNKSFQPRDGEWQCDEQQKVPVPVPPSQPPKPKK